MSAAESCCACGEGMGGSRTKNQTHYSLLLKTFKQEAYITVGATLGVELKGVTAGVTTSLTTSLGYESLTTTGSFQEETHSYTVTVQPCKASAAYALDEELLVRRWNKRQHIVDWIHTAPLGAAAVA